MPKALIIPKYPKNIKETSKEYYRCPLGILMSIKLIGTNSAIISIIIIELIDVNIQ